MKLEPAQIADAAPLAKIMSDWLDETAWAPNLHRPDEDALFLQKLITDGDTTVLRNWRGVHGFLARDGATIHALYLAQKLRGQGWGKRLMDLAKSKETHLTLWTFQSNAGARAFYKREGFVEVERTDGAGNDEKLPDIRMVWTRGDNNG